MSRTSADTPGSLICPSPNRRHEGLATLTGFGLRGEPFSQARRPAVEQADVAVFTVPGERVVAVIEELDGALAGRVAVDATNVLTPGAAVLNHVDVLATAGATAFRTFNSTGWEQLARPVFGDQRADMPYAGPDTPARDRVEHLVADLGFRPVWLGAGVDAIASTDALARLWFQLAFGRGWGRRVGFRLLTERGPRWSCPRR